MAERREIDGLANTSEKERESMVGRSRVQENEQEREREREKE